MNQQAHMTNGNTAGVKHNLDTGGRSGLRHANCDETRSRSRHRSGAHAVSQDADANWASFAPPVPKATVTGMCAPGGDAAIGQSRAGAAASTAGEDERSAQVTASSVPEANRYRNSIDAALQGVLLEPPILQMEGVPGWRRVDPEAHAQHPCDQCCWA